MVLKMLKGLGRLMLTTGLLCGVGLFLCSSEVKAAIDVTLTQGSSAGTFKVTVTSVAGDDIDKITGVKLFKSGTTPIYDTGTLTTPVSVTPGTDATYEVSASEFIKGTGINDTNVTDGSPIGIDQVEVTYNKPTAGVSDTVSLASVLKTPINSKNIYKVTAANGVYSTTFLPDFNCKIGDGTTTTDEAFGYKDDVVKITPTKTTFSLSNYYMNVYKTGGSTPNGLDTNWKQADVYEHTISDTTANNKLTFAFLPKFKKLKITDPASGQLDIAVSGTATETSVVKYEIDTTDLWEQSGESYSATAALQNFAFVSETNNIGSSFATFSAEPTASGTNGSYTVTTKLQDAGDVVGNGELKIIAKLGNIEVKNIVVPVKRTIGASGYELQNTPITVMAGATKSVAVVKRILPGAAEQDFTKYTWVLTPESGATLFGATPTFDGPTGTVTVKAKSGATGTAKLKLTMKDKAGTSTIKEQTFDVVISSFDVAKTISAITDSKSGRNYITYNKDKNYSLDIKQLIINNAKDTSGNAVTLTKDQIKDVKVGGTTLSDGIWKPTDAVLNAKVNCVIDNTYAITDASNLTVSAYPMPTATYNNSARTVTVKMPGKVSTGLDDASTNIRDVRGFKLILVDSSGNAIGDYTDSKYQKVLSSTTGLTAGDYTISASDIEGMITSAASNGKFSNDTTSVKFKVIPMGYKQSNTSDDDTIRAKDEIYGTTDSTTVYKVSASGTGFDSSSAYGLDGQTVSITATPQAGYSFKQWSDGNTSNPRQVKVSASGTRAFQAVAGERLDPTKNGGDNSSLYDDVPKTAESNSAIWLIVFMVFAVMGTTYALYLQLKAATSKNDK